MKSGDFRAPEVPETIAILPQGFAKDRVTFKIKLCGDYRKLTVRTRPRRFGSRSLSGLPATLTCFSKQIHSHKINDK